MTVNILVIIICLAVFVQPNKERRIAALIFGAVIAAHTGLMPELDGLAYYVSGAIAASAIVILTSFFDKVPRLVISLHKICFSAIILNAIGWLMWVFYLPPIMYNMAFIALYLWAIFTLMAGSGGYVIIGDRNNGWYANLLVDYSSRVSNSFKGSE